MDDGRQGSHKEDVKTMAKISKTHHVTKQGVIKKNPNQRIGWKRYTRDEFERMGHNDVVGYVVEYDPPLYVAVFNKDKEVIKDGRKVIQMSAFPLGWSKKKIGRFQLVDGGFGSAFYTMGRMVSGEFYETLEDVEKNSPISFGPEYKTSSSTKEAFKYVWVKNGQPVKKVD
jgi:hypothetical protein